MKENERQPLSFEEASKIVKEKLGVALTEEAYLLILEICGNR